MKHPSRLTSRSRRLSILAGILILTALPATAPCQPSNQGTPSLGDSPSTRPRLRLCRQSISGRAGHRGTLELWSCARISTARTTAGAPARATSGKVGRPTRSDPGRKAPGRKAYRRHGRRGGRAVRTSGRQGLPARPAGRERGARARADRGGRLLSPADQRRALGLQSPGLPGLKERPGGQPHDRPQGPKRMAPRPSSAPSARSSPCSGKMEGLRRSRERGFAWTISTTPGEGS